MRQFIRHPADIPIEISAGDADPCGRHNTSNLGLGGLAFCSERAIDPGSVIALRIAYVRPPFATTARVVWCAARGECYELGVEFLDPDDVFRARMVEQVCHIEEYRITVQRDEGRLLSPEQAALEWIEKHAAQFPDAAGRDGAH